MDEATTPDERAKIMAACLLDGEGERWARLAVEIHNASIRICAAHGVTGLEFKGLADMEYFRDWNPPQEVDHAATAEEWAAAEATLKRLAGF